MNPGASLPVGSWIHSFEEDSSSGQVFRPAGAVFPLSRRPRRRLEFSADGAATVADGGADDRLVAARARCDIRGGTVRIICPDGTVLEVVEASPERLVVRPGAAPAE